MSSDTQANGTEHTPEFEYGCCFCPEAVAKEDMVVIGLMWSDDPAVAPTDEDGRYQQYWAHRKCVAQSFSEDVRDTLVWAEEHT